MKFQLSHRLENGVQNGSFQFQQMTWFFFSLNLVQIEKKDLLEYVTIEINCALNCLN